MTVRILHAGALKSDQKAYGEAGARRDSDSPPLCEESSEIGIHEINWWRRSPRAGGKATSIHEEKHRDLGPRHKRRVGIIDVELHASVLALNDFFRWQPSKHLVSVGISKLERLA